jgi:dUTP pyrophosphatase
MNVKVELVENGKLPVLATKGAAAFDCFSRKSEWLEEEGYMQVHLGFKIEVPEGYVAKLFPRSSVSNAGLHLANSVGIIDSDYRGEVMARFYPAPSSLLVRYENEADFLNHMNNVYAPGNRCVQIRIEKNEEVEFVVGELSSTDRSSGGFGSTGK